MKNDQEIRRTVRAAIDDCTRGIDEAPSLQFRIARKARGEEPVKKKISFRIICVIAALLLGTMTALAAGVEDVNAVLYKLWPEAARALRPLDLSTEQGGIRLDVISAVLYEDHYLVTYSLTDLEGDWFSEETDCSPTLMIPVKARSGWNKLLSFDSEEHRIIFGAYFDYTPDPNAPAVRDTDQITFSVNGLMNPVTTAVDLWPLMEGRDYTAEAVPAPADRCWMNTDPEAEDEETVPDILNPANNLHIPLTDGIELSGMGWIDGNLHVQIRMADNSIVMEKEIAWHEFIRCDAVVTVLDRDGREVIWDADFMAKRPVRDINWTEDGDSWTEVIFPVQPEEMEGYTIRGEFTNMRSGIEDLLQYEWSVSFPANMIREEK